MDNLWKLRSYLNLPSKLIWLAYSGSTRLDDDLPAFFWSVGFSSDGMLQAPNDNAITASSEAKTRRIGTSLDCCRTNDVLSVQGKYILQAATPARRRTFASAAEFPPLAGFRTMSSINGVPSSSLSQTHVTALKPSLSMARWRRLQAFPGAPSVGLSPALTSCGAERFLSAVQSAAHQRVAQPPPVARSRHRPAGAFARCASRSAHGGPHHAGNNRRRAWRPG